MHKGLDQEVVFSLDYEYSVTRVSYKMSWYSPCVSWIRGGMSGRGVGGRTVYVVDWVCVRGLFGCVL